MEVCYILKEAILLLKDSTTPALDSRLLLAHTLNCSQEKLLLNYCALIHKDIVNIFFTLIKRRQELEPLAYILGNKEFYSLEFLVNKSVLIPRPETELIIDALKQDIGQSSYRESINILELGVGSGSVSTCIAKEILLANITATDVSQEALKVATLNIHKHQVNNKVRLLESNWYSALDTGYKYDYIISNPPYICQSEINSTPSSEIDFEPKIALYTDSKGLGSYQLIINEAERFLTNSGKLILEIGYLQKGVISNMLKSTGLRHIIVKKDLSGIDRVLIANK